ncbi:MAG: hypothetical protein LDL33_14930, partial [Desulfomonile sp.]|nr:hypothetical protein [Desulfomonile sp.]
SSAVRQAGTTNPSCFVSGAYLYMIASDGTGYDLYRWDGTRLTQMSDLNFGDLSFETAVGGDLYFYGYISYGGSDLYRWSGQDFTRMTYDLDTDGLDFFLIYLGDLYFGAWTAGYEQWRFWATHRDFLYARMP